MTNFRTNFVQIASSDPKLVSIADEVDSKFSIGDIEVDDGNLENILIIIIRICL